MRISAGANGIFYGIGQSFTAVNSTISGNQIRNNSLSTTSGSLCFLINDSNGSTNAIITNNYLYNNYRTTTGTNYLAGYYNISSPASTGTMLFDNNIIDQIGIDLNSSGYCLPVRIGSSYNQVKTITNNTVSNFVSGTSATIFAAGIKLDKLPAGSLVSNNIVHDGISNNVMIGLSCAGQTSVFAGTNQSFTVSDNTIYSITSAATFGTVVGLCAATEAGAYDLDIYGNTIYDITGSASGTQVIYGLTIGGGNSSSVYDVYDNHIYEVSGNSTSGNLSVAGLDLTQSGGTYNIYNNNVHDIWRSTNSTLNGVYGFVFPSGSGTFNIYNNFIQRIYANNSASYTAVIGMELYGLSTYNCRFNTIALGYDTPLSGGTTLGFFGVQWGPSATLHFSNNIVYVNGTTSGGGVGACLNWATTGTAYAVPVTFGSGSNNNYYYINQGLHNYVYVSGTLFGTCVNGYAYGGATTDVTRNLNNDECFNDASLGLYKTFMSPRESNSYYDVMPFAGGAAYPANLKLTAGSTNYAESNASVVAGITTDYEGDVRSGTTPDIGADEGDFIMQTISCYLLPVELTDFYGIPNGMINELHWRTESELNADFFILEKSMDGVTFDDLTTVKAAGNSASHTQYFFRMIM
ncbi:MAG: hypothetical protein R2794_02510 [Chitinophagales bacterium]